MSEPTVAIVDDDPQYTSYVQTLLSDKGFHSALYLSAEALLAALDDGTSHSMVLLEVTLPGSAGVDALRNVRHHYPALPIVVVSRRMDPATVIEAVRQGATDYVTKSHEGDELFEHALESAVRSVVERSALSEEVSRLRASISDNEDGETPGWGASEAMKIVIARIDKVADNDISVMLRGESGVGKEVVAREIHRRSTRRLKPFVKVNVAALPTDLLESELFGHERGAFTGARAARIGKFEFASDGTIMLDEIGEMALALQAKILHVLQDREFTKLGSNERVTSRARVIAASNRDLEAMMRAGTFREDLYHRLHEMVVRVPPLRDRREEIPLLVDHFLAKYAHKYNRPAMRPSPSLQSALLNHHWPGNVRDLENVVKRYVVLQDEAEVVAELARAAPPSADAEPLKVSREFTFPEPARFACEQYLMYFGQFLADLGIQADVRLREKAQKVLFDVVPASQAEALERIAEALELFLAIPFNKHWLQDPDVATQQLRAQVAHLESQLALARAVHRYQEATIEQHERSLARFQSEPAREAKPEEPIESVAVIEKVVSLEPIRLGPVRFELPEMLKWLKRRR